MIMVLNIGRFLMVLWIGYGLLLIFAPAVLHHAPDQLAGAIHVVVAFAVGHLLDRALSAMRRRQAHALTEQAAAGAGANEE